MSRVHVVIPALNEASAIGRLIAHFQTADVDVIVVDGGSTDGTAERAREAGAMVIHAERGRAVQMHAGATEALKRGAGVLLFWHADCVPPSDWREQLDMAADSWGRFDVRLVREHGELRPVLPIVGWSMNWRSALTGICTGDQGLVVSAPLYARVGGFPVQPLMEDIEISRRLKQHAGRPTRLPGPVSVSARRWQRDGVVRTVLSMWWMRLRYFFGVSPQRLAREYYRVSTTSSSG